MPLLTPADGAMANPVMALQEATSLPDDDSESGPDYNASSVSSADDGEDFAPADGATAGSSEDAPPGYRCLAGPPS